MKKLILMALMVVFTGSCAFVLAGSAGMVGAYAWSQGELSRNYRQPLVTAWEGVKHALGVSKLVVEEQAIGPHYGKIVANTPGSGEKVIVGMEKWTKAETRVTVRVGVMGDRPKSERIHEEIEKALR